MWEYRLINESNRANSADDVKCMNQTRKYEIKGISLDRMTRLELEDKGILFVHRKA
jgi:hypothetical protein